jgi:hypothetical protein
MVIPETIKISFFKMDGKFFIFVPTKRTVHNRPMSGWAANFFPGKTFTA